MKLVLLLISWALAWSWGMVCTLRVIKRKYPAANRVLLQEIRNQDD